MTGVSIAVIADMAVMCMPVIITQMMSHAGSGQEENERALGTAL